jgi:hypothetical protein
MDNNVSSSATNGGLLGAAGTVTLSPAVQAELPTDGGRGSPQRGGNGTVRMTDNHAARDLLTFRETQGQPGASSRSWAYAAGLLEDALNGGMTSVEKPGYAGQRLALLPAIPHQRLLGIGVLVSTSLLHLRHS